MLATVGALSADSSAATIAIPQVDSSIYRPYRARGRATVKGQAFLKTAGGDIKLGAGDKVYLVPATDEWSRFIVGAAAIQDRLSDISTSDVSPAERLRLLDETPSTLPKLSPYAEKYARITIAGVDGRFTFESIPAGTYYAWCRIEWEIPNVGGGTGTTGGTAMQTIPVPRIGAVEVILTR